MTAINDDTVKCVRGALYLLQELMHLSEEEQDEFNDALTDLAMSEALDG